VIAGLAAAVTTGATKAINIAVGAELYLSSPPIYFFDRPIFLLMEEHIEIEGRIVSVLAGTMFRVALANGHQVLATLSGKMRKRFVRLTTGDRVKMEMSPYDLNKARIVWRIG